MKSVFIQQQKSISTIEKQTKLTFCKALSIFEPVPNNTFLLKKTM